MNFEKKYGFNWRVISNRMLALLFFAALVLYMVWPLLSGSAKTTRTLTVYGFSILADAMTEGIFPAFADEWEKANGEKIEFISSFAGSGTITNQIIMGVPAEIALLSLELDAIRLAENKVVKNDSWKKFPYNGVVNLTPIIFVVRHGNPRDIKNFSDLTRNGIGIVHPDPLTSGAAQWALLAEYGSALFGGDESKAYMQLRDTWKNVVAQAASAKAAGTQFKNGFGDVLITYEQEALYDKYKNRLKGEIVYPNSTILTGHTVVAIDKNIPVRKRELINAFLDFLWSEDAQRIFIKYGFRSINEKLNSNQKFNSIQKLFTAEDLGGWKQAKEVIIENIWVSKILKEIKD